MRAALPAEINAAFTSQTIQEYDDQKCIAPLISVRTQSRIPPAWARNLAGILTRSTGHDHINAYRAAANIDIPCGYLPSYCSRAVAEHAVMAAMVLLRKLKNQISAFETFARDGLTGHECQGRNLLVVGVGNIGSEMVDIARGLRMNIKGVDIVPKTKDIEYVFLTDGIPWADIIMCAVPLTRDTNHMLSYDALKMAKRGVIIVNIARGEITPVADMQRLLSEGIVGGLSMDVYEQEYRLGRLLRAGETITDKTLAVIMELKKRDNVLCTPHNAFNTEESVARKASQSIEAVKTFLETKTFPHLVPDR